MSKVVIVCMIAWDTVIWVATLTYSTTLCRSSMTINEDSDLKLQNYAQKKTEAFTVLVRAKKNIHVIQVYVH